MAEVKVKRTTKQRRLIKNILMNTDSHPAADWIYEEARKVLPDISLGTVYRNLQVLLEEGSIQELNYGKEFSRYDGNPELHYHFVCEGCSKIIDINIPSISESFINNIEKNTNLKIKDHRLELYGLCPQCEAKRAKVEQLEA